jgi:hypothetical protein
MSKYSLLRYHPERYRRTRPFSKKVASVYWNTTGTNPPTIESLDAITNIIINTYNNEISLMPRESRPTETRMLMREPSIASYYGAYCANGRNIFHLNDEILQEFLYTDVEAVPIGLVDFPYDCFYISFGSIKELTLYHENYHIDGAYVFAFDGLPLQIALTTSVSNWDYSSRYEWIFNPDRYYYMAIERSNPSATFGVLIEEALRKELDAHIDKGEMLDTGVYEIEGKSVGVINKRPESARKDQEEISSGFNTFRVALNLVVNTLCYISQYKNEIKESWPKDTPQSLLSKLETAKNPKQTQRVISKLVSMGYTKLKVCGGSFEKPKLSGIGSEICPHWRRGHWRQQPYGEGLKERKIIWIRPTIVRKDKGNPESGHIYEMSKEKG